MRLALHINAHAEPHQYLISKLGRPALNDSTDNIVADTTRRILADLCDPQTINAAQDDSWQPPLWHALEQNGLSLAWVRDTAGGAGISLADGFEILRISGQYAVPVALAETLLAGWLLDHAGASCPSGPMTIAPIRDDDTIVLNDDGTLSGRARSVPFARHANDVVVLAQRGDQHHIAVVDPTTITLTDRPTDLGSARCDLTFNNTTPKALYDTPSFLNQRALWAMGATARACQITGALETALDISTNYTQERHAFGRPIAKFQAVQHNLARLAGEVAAALTASGSAADTLQHTADLASPTVFLEVASAKIRVGEAAKDGIAIAHQVHGAIGFTAEYILQRYTRRILGWRDDFGSETAWATQLGNTISAAGADALWPLLTTR